ncbi:MAG: Fur family ferric uptake transcriptional regulator [Planctomycetota bacterium]|jgi:Fur family ferric uptake transcriptional regulator
MQRSTKQRRAIQATLSSSARPLSPKEIVQLAQKQGEILSLTTVYRSLKLMVENGDLAHAEIPGQPARYEVAGLDHHHHFHCEDCDRLFDIPGCPSKVHSLAPAGFVTRAHDLTLRGTCPDCS